MHEFGIWPAACKFKAMPDLLFVHVYPDYGAVFIVFNRRNRGNRNPEFLVSQKAVLVRREIVRVYLAYPAYFFAFKRVYLCVLEFDQLLTIVLHSFYLILQPLKEMNFPADKGAIVRFIEQSNRPESKEVLPFVQKIDERQYQNVSEVAEAARLVQG